MTGLKAIELETKFSPPLNVQVPTLLSVIMRKKLLPPYDSGRDFEARKFLMEAKFSNGLHPLFSQWIQDQVFDYQLHDGNF